MHFYVCHHEIWAATFRDPKNYFGVPGFIYKQFRPKPSIMFVLLSVHDKDRTEPHYGVT